MHSFSIHLIAEELKVPREQIEEHTEPEGEMLVDSMRMWRKCPRTLDTLEHEQH